MVTPKTGKPRGRPTKLLTEDPERYAIALSDALQAMGMGEKDSFYLSAALMFSEAVDSAEMADGRVRVTYESARPGFPSVTISGKSDTIRGKSKLRRKRGQQEVGVRPEDAAWRKHMGLAFIVALSTKDFGVGCASIRSLADSVGENAFAEAVLIPMLQQKFQPPDFSPPD